jgi:hypothetical protein
VRVSFQTITLWYGSPVRLQRRHIGIGQRRRRQRAWQRVRCSM